MEITYETAMLVRQVIEIMRIVPDEYRDEVAADLENAMDERTVEEYADVLEHYRNTIRDGFYGTPRD